jgi:hypothetical protein
MTENKRAKDRVNAVRYRRRRRHGLIVRPAQAAGRLPLRAQTGDKTTNKKSAKKRSE